MSLVEFRKMENDARNISNTKAKQSLKLSFRKLAAATDKSAAAAGPKAGPSSKSPDNNHNRKDLYSKASIYLNQVMSAVKNRKSFALEPGFRILQKMTEGVHPHDELFIMAIHPFLNVINDDLKY